MISIQSRKYYTPLHMTKIKKGTQFKPRKNNQNHIFQCDGMKVVPLIFLNTYQRPHMEYTNCKVTDAEYTHLGREQYYKAYDVFQVLHMAFLRTEEVCTTLFLFFGLDRM